MRTQAPASESTDSGLASPELAARFIMAARLSKGVDQSVWNAATAQTSTPA